MKLHFGLGLLFVLVGACGDGGSSPVGGDMAMGGGILTGDACAASVGAGTAHSGFLMANETWTASGSPHTIASTLYLRGATITIEPCAVVRLAAGVDIQIGDGAGSAASAIVAHGSAQLDAQGNATNVRPVIFRGPEGGAHWGSLVVNETGSLDFELVGLTGGGSQASGQNGGGTIVAYGPGKDVATPMLRMLGVLVDGSGSYGVNLQRQAAFTADSIELGIQGAGAEPKLGAVDNRFPMYIEPPAVGSIPSGSYTGNAQDEILVYSHGAVSADVSFHQRGVPYHIRAQLYLRTADHATINTLSIDPGVRLRFDSSDLQSELRLGDGAGGTVANQRYTRLIAQGTAAEPIVLTSAATTPAPGDWAGIYFSGGPPSGNIMSHVTVEYAGGDSTTNGYGCGPGDNDAAILIIEWKPADAFIQACTVSNSLGSGIVSGWVSDASGPDLKTGNTFFNIGTGCEVARWANATGPACPGTRPLCL